MQNHRRPPATYKFRSKPHLLVVEARFYEDIGALQMQGATAVLDRVDATYETLAVPGALEIAAAIRLAFQGSKYDGYIALGCVLKGGTMHDEIVAVESARALQDIAVRHCLAIGNGILTCETHAQAIERADPARMDRAGAAAEAALRMIEIKQHYGLNRDVILPGAAR